MPPQRLCSLSHHAPPPDQPPPLPRGRGGVPSAAGAAGGAAPAAVPRRVPHGDRPRRGPRGRPPPRRRPLPTRSSNRALGSVGFTWMRRWGGFMAPRGGGGGIHEIPPPLHPHIPPEPPKQTAECGNIKQGNGSRCFYGLNEYLHSPPLPRGEGGGETGRAQFGCDRIAT